jgi:transcriptional regulator GlxA family with amidase domain
VLPDHTFADAPELDVILLPGGHGSRHERENPAMLEFVRRVAPGCTWVTSVCTGSFVLEAAGPAKGKRVTTHWGAIEELRALAPDLTVLENVRYVRDGNLVTSAGVSAGIDMSLWLVGQIWSVDHARVTQYAMEYDPAPPYGALV